MLLKFGEANVPNKQVSLKCQMCTCQDFADFVSQSVPHHRITTPFMVMGVDLGGGGRGLSESLKVVNHPP